MPEALQLLTEHINFTEVSAEVYDRVRAFCPSSRRPLTNDEIASKGYCEVATIAMTGVLQRQFQMLGNVGLQAHSEVHKVRAAYHCFTAVRCIENPEDTGAIVDATYKQFISRDHRPHYSNLFIGTPEDIIQLLKGADQLSPSVDFYKPHTLSSDTPESYLSKPAHTLVSRS